MSLTEYVVVWWWNRMIYNRVPHTWGNERLWFDDEIEWYTTNYKSKWNTDKLWFDDEIEWYTTNNEPSIWDNMLWFDDEIEWYTTGHHRGTTRLRVVVWWWNRMIYNSVVSVSSHITVVVWWWNRMIYNRPAGEYHPDKLWFDDEIEWYTTSVIV